MDVQTWTGFDGHELVIKQKVTGPDNSKSFWAVYENWHPKASDSNLSKLNDKKTDLAKPLSKDAMKNIVFISGYPHDVQASEHEAKLKSDLIGKEDHTLFSKMVAGKKGATLLYFCDPKTIPAFVQKYSGKDFLGKTVRISQG